MQNTNKKKFCKQKKKSAFLLNQQAFLECNIF